MTLDLYRQGQLATSRTWVNLQPEERRRRAVAAVAEQDVGTLLNLLEAHHVRTHGHVSKETLRKYKLGARTWLGYAQSNAVKVLHPEAEHADLWVRELEVKGKSPASVGVLLAGARALYAALRWTKATTDHPFTDVKPRKDKRRPLASVAWHGVDSPVPSWAPGMSARYSRLEATLVQIQQVCWQDLGQIGDELSAPRLILLSGGQRLFFSSVARS